MGLKEKLKKIRAEAARKSFELPENEKTGVLNSILVLGAAIGALISQQQTAHSTATPTDCRDSVNQKVTETDIPTNDLNLGFTPATDWQDHCWWDHWDHWDFWDFCQFTNSGG